MMAHREGSRIFRFVSSGLAWAAVAGFCSTSSPADLVWTDEDWSGGNYVSALNVDGDVHPGLLVLDQSLDDIRFLSSPIDFQGLYSMIEFRDSLFITCSDHPYTYDGAAVLTYDYPTDNYAVPYEPYESGLHLIKQYGDSLYLPGPDSMDPWTTPGSIYMYTGSEWLEKATIPNAIHVNDVDIVNGVTYVTTGHWFSGVPGYGCVWRSFDYGDTFERVFDLPPNPEHYIRRIFGAGSWGDRLFVQPDGLPPETEVIYSTVNGVDWDTIPIPGLPVDVQATFTTWGDSLLMTMTNRMYIYAGEEWSSHFWLPFNQGRWCRGLHEYKGQLYGGGNTCRIFRWLGGSNWEQVAQMGLNPGSEEIEAMATLYGRLYVSTSRNDPELLGRLYVSAAESHGFLISNPNDFGMQTRNAVLSWTDHRPGEGNLARLRIRSGLTLEEMNSSPFVGPDGTPTTYYEESGTPLPADHHGHRHFQYTVELLCPEGLQMPFLDSVTLEADSLDYSDVAESVRGNEAAIGAIRFAPPYPNPAPDVVRLEVSWDGAELRLAGGTDAQQQLQLRVLDLQGRLVRTTQVTIAPSGQADWRWDLCDDRGQRVAAGVYQVAALAGEDPQVIAARPVVVLP
jgi:hypothetical protein